MLPLRPKASESGLEQGSRRILVSWSVYAEKWRGIGKTSHWRRKRWRLSEGRLSGNGNEEFTVAVSGRKRKQFDEGRSLRSVWVRGETRRHFTGTRDELEGTENDSKYKEVRE